MPSVADTLLERHFRNTAFSFATAPAPSDATPKYVAGSNLLTSYKNYTELRPGFGAGTNLETAPTTFADPIVRTFCWRRWGGTFYIMLCTSGAVAKVWKLAIGSDASFVLMWTSTSPEPFDFVVSNNFCFFGNGTDMRKFDGTTVTKWGIAAPGTTTASAYAGTGADGANGFTVWTNPTNFQGAPDASVAVSSASTPGHFSFKSNFLNGTNYGFAVTTSVIGVTVTITCFCNTLTGFPSMTVSLIYLGTQIGTSKTVTVPNGSTAVVLGSATDTWGATLTNAIVNDVTFGIQVTCTGVNPGGTPKTFTFSMDSAQIVLTVSVIPTTSTAGTGITATTGWQYVFCYMNVNTGHVSSPSDPSVSTGPVANKTVNVAVTASTDPQVTNIRVFRTTDGGGGIFFEIAGGPFPNTSTNIADTTTDANLSLITAPTFGFNDPPPNMKGMVWFANRIWGFNNATLFFTDWEEMNIGVPEEGSVSGPAGNFWNFSSEITGLSVAQDGVIIFCAGHIYKIDGDSLDTFRRTVIADGLGCRNRATITRLGGLTAFLANTNSVWTTDSTSLTEISQMIQPTLDNIDHSQASMCFHLQGQYRWLLLADQGHSQTLAFDVNSQQWMPPWTIVGQGLSSGETSPGSWTLLLGQQTSNKMLQMTPNVYSDNGVTYTASGTFNLIPLVNEHLSSGSPIIDLFYPQATGHVSYLEYVGMDTGAVLPTSVKFLADDDPATGVYTDITANIQDAQLRFQGTNVVDKWYYARKPTMKRVSIQINWAGENNFKLYTLSLAYRVYR